MVRSRVVVPFTDVHLAYVACQVSTFREVGPHGGKFVTNANYTIFTVSGYDKSSACSRDQSDGNEVAVKINFSQYFVQNFLWEE